MFIKILNINDLHDFRNIRLAALLHAPKMFGSYYEVEVQAPLISFQNCLLNSTVFAVYAEHKIIGLAILTQETSIKAAHKASLSSVFIRPEFQGQGVASKLLNTVIEYAKIHVEQVLLIVASDNIVAINLYKKMGFQVYGVEKKALKENKTYTDELLMKLFLV
jgi:ribosomal protein S18 acetylase RimI-like enzyme